MRQTDDLRALPERYESPAETIRDRIARFLIAIAAWLVIGVLAWILGDIVVGAVQPLRAADRDRVVALGPSFLIEPVEDAGRAGGIGPVLLSTVWILAVTIGVAVPLALCSAVALTEKLGPPSTFARHVQRCLDVLAGVPSIVFGLFGNAFFVMFLGMGYSILAGGLTLACMVLPMLVRIFEQAIIAVPADDRLAAASLGMTRAATLRRIILPAALPSLAAGTILCIGRALAETAALLFTSGYVARTPSSLFDSGRSLSVHIYDLAMNVPGGSPAAYATACVLVAFLLVIHAMTFGLLGLAGVRMKRDVDPGR